METVLRPPVQSCKCYVGYLKKGEGCSAAGTRQISLVLSVSSARGSLSWTSYSCDVGGDGGGDGVASGNDVVVLFGARDAPPRLES